MIIILATAAQLLYGPTSTEAERRQKLSGLFTPRPGAELTLDRLSLLENSSRPSYIKGYIGVKPPAGQCVIIRTDFKNRDQLVCKPTQISWEIEDLDAFGRLNFQAMLQTEWDEGTSLSWKTNIRLGNFVASGKAGSGEYEDIPIKSCTATTVDNERSILLESFEGRRWRISLPEFDTPIHAKEAVIPNLMVNIDSKMTAEKEARENAGKGAQGKTDEHGKPLPAATDEHGKTAEPEAGEDGQGEKKPAAGGGGSALGRLLTKGYIKEELPEIKFILPARGSFKMESGRFTETGSPRGMNGLCRYMFKNAPGDPKSGAVECNDTDTLDSVYINVTCFPELKERLAPKSKIKSEVKGK